MFSESTPLKTWHAFTPCRSNRISSAAPRWFVAAAGSAAGLILAASVAAIDPHTRDNYANHVGAAMGQSDGKQKIAVTDCGSKQQPNAVPRAARRRTNGGIEMTRYRKPGLAAVLAALITNAAVAADLSPLLVGEPRPAEAEGGWTFSVAPYFWIAGLSGDTAQFGLPSVHIDSSFSDIFGNLDFAFMAAGEARYDRFSVIGDVIYTKLSADAETPIRFLASDVDVMSESFSGSPKVGAVAAP